MSGSAIGLFAGLNKISRTAKARQDIEWINGTIDKDTDNEPRQKILKELRLSQEGRLIAAHYVPWWKFMLLPAWAIGYAAPTIQSVNRSESLNGFVLSSLIYLLVCFYLSWLTVGWYAERVRINEHYRVGLSIEARIFHRRRWTPHPSTEYADAALPLRWLALPASWHGLRLDAARRAGRLG